MVKLGDWFNMSICHIYSKFINSILLARLVGACNLHISHHTPSGRLHSVSRHSLNNTFEQNHNLRILSIIAPIYSSPFFNISSVSRRRQTLKYVITWRFLTNENRLCFTIYHVSALHFTH